MMATATKNPAQTNTNQNGSPTKKALRPTIALPAELTVAKSETRLAGGSRSSGPNPLIGAVKTANENRGNSFDIGPATTTQVHDKIVRLLQAAARQLNCSVRCSKYDAYKGVVKFEVRDMITRSKKANTTTTAVQLG